MSVSDCMTTYSTTYTCFYWLCRTNASAMSQCREPGRPGRPENADVLWCFVSVTPERSRPRHEFFGSVGGGLWIHVDPWCFQVASCQVNTASFWNGCGRLGGPNSGGRSLQRKTPVGRFTAGSPTNSSMKRKEHDLNQTCVIMFHVNLYTVYLQLHFYTTDFPFKTGPKANGFRPVKIPELMFETSRQAWDNPFTSRNWLDGPN